MQSHHRRKIESTEKICCILLMRVIHCFAKPQTEVKPHLNLKLGQDFETELRAMFVLSSLYCVPEKCYVCFSYE